jgi:hypothetical protein
MKNSFLLFSMAILLSECTSHSPEQFEEENAQLNVTIDSLEMELERVQKLADVQRMIAERQTEEALRQKDIAEEQAALAQEAVEIAKQQEKRAMMQATKARIAADSSNAAMMRLKEIKK